VCVAVVVTLPDVCFGFIIFGLNGFVENVVGVDAQDVFGFVHFGVVAAVDLLVPVLAAPGLAVLDAALERGLLDDLFLRFVQGIHFVDDEVGVGTV